MALNEGIIIVIQASALLAIFSWLCGTITTYVRGKTYESPNSEDVAVINFFNKVFFVPTGKISTTDGNEEKDATLNRWLRIGINNTANIPFAVIIFFMSAYTEALPLQYLNIIVWIYVVSRLLHTLAYALAIQPWRTISYSVGCTCMFIGAGSLFLI